VRRQQIAALSRPLRCTYMCYFPVFFRLLFFTQGIITCFSNPPPLSTTPSENINYLRVAPIPTCRTRRRRRRLVGTSASSSVGTRDARTDRRADSGGVSAGRARAGGISARPCRRGGVGTPTGRRRRVGDVPTDLGSALKASEQEFGGASRSLLRRRRVVGASGRRRFIARVSHVAACSRTSRSGSVLRGTRASTSSRV
jgi:hypothetical protein